MANQQSGFVTLNSPVPAESWRNNALAHSLPNKIEAAYRRGDLLERRIPLMETWAAYCMPNVGSSPDSTS